MQHRIHHEFYLINALAPIHTASTRAFLAQDRGKRSPPTPGAPAPCRAAPNLPPFPHRSQTFYFFFVGIDLGRACTIPPQKKKKGSRPGDPDEGHLEKVLQEPSPLAEGTATEGRSTDSVFVEVRVRIMRNYCAQRCHLQPSRRDKSLPPTHGGPSSPLLPRRCSGWKQGMHSSEGGGIRVDEYPLTLP